VQIIIHLTPVQLQSVGQQMTRPRQNEMEVDDGGSVGVSKSVMASSGTVGSVSVSLHPLVIMNISEHWTRLRAQEGTAQQGNLPFRKVL
jgi:hypothetical protein